MKFKVYILYPFRDTPYGGANQFLRALRDEFQKSDHLAITPEEADAFLFDSFQESTQVIAMKLRYPKKIFVHRIDGPVSLYRGSQHRTVDRLVYGFTESIADGTVFQSQYSRNRNKEFGIRAQRIEETILNAPDGEIFAPASKKELDPSRRVQLVSSSWSPNWRKGFDVYQYLDEHLDFTRYEYVFIGNSPISFRNIRVLPPQTSAQVAEILRSSDIYVTASRHDPCSNALIEALACGLPAAVLNDGGHPELIREGGEIFENAADALEKIERIRICYHKYTDRLPRFDIRNSADQYLGVFHQLRLLKDKGGYTPKTVTLGGIFSLFCLIFENKLRELWNR